MPQNHGSAKPLQAIAREGSYFNAVYPAPSGGRSANPQRIFEVVVGALAPIVPEKAIAAFSPFFQPECRRDGRPHGGRISSIYDMIFGGLGAQSRRDGIEGLSPVMNCTNIPVEILEARQSNSHSSSRIHRRFAGAGKFRGGCGVRKDVELLNSSASLCNLGDRHVHQPFGLFGGKPGVWPKPSSIPTTARLALDSKETRMLKKGDVVSWRLSGAGGYGDPGERGPRGDRGRSCGRFHHRGGRQAGLRVQRFEARGLNRGADGRRGGSPSKAVAGPDAARFRVWCSADVIRFDRSEPLESKIEPLRTNPAAREMGSRK